MSKETYGTETIKKAVGAVISLAENVEQAIHNDDQKKVTVPEAITIAVKSIPDVYNVARNFGQIQAEYKDLTAEEREDIKNWVKEQFDIENDYLEEKIEAAFDIAVAVEKYFSIKKA